MNLKKVAGFAIGPLGAAVLGAITLPITTWFFDAQDIGRISMFQVALSLGVALFTLGLDQAYVREYHEDENKSQLLRNTALPGIALMLAFLCLLFIKPTALSYYLFDIHSTEISMLVALSFMATLGARFLSLILRMQERGVAFSMSKLLPKLIFLLLLGVYVLFRDKFTFLMLIAAHTLSLVAVLVIYSWNTRKDLILSVREKIDHQRLKYLIHYSLPLVGATVAFWGLTAMDRVFLRTMSTFDELGIYSVSMSFAAAAAVVQTIFSTVWSPLVYKWSAQGINQDKIYNIIGLVLSIVLLLFSLAGLFSWISEYLLPAKYNNVQYLLLACMSYPLMYALSEATKVGIGLSRKTGYSMVASVVAFIVNAMGNYVLIPHFGAAGAAVSTAISFWLFFVLRTEFSIRVWIALPRLLLYIPTLLCVIASSAIALLGDSINVPFKVFCAVIFIFSILLAKHFKARI